MPRTDPKPTGRRPLRSPERVQAILNALRVFARRQVDARTWQAVDAGLPARQACRVMVGLLDLAATGACEAALADRLDVLLDAGQLPDLAALKNEFAPKIPQIVDVTIPAPDLAAYNPLLKAEACS